MRELPASQRRNPNEPPSHSISLRLNEIHDLFALPRLNAFREDYLPLSGIDQIALQLRKARLRKGLHVTFILPESADGDPNLQREVQNAIQRYCTARLTNLLFDLKARQLTVIRSLQIGVLILGGSLALAAAITRSEGIVEWLRMLLSNAVSIFGSVALWSPADAFLFGIRPMYKDVRIYLAIRDMSFDIQYEKPEARPVITDQIPYVRGIR